MVVDFQGINQRYIPKDPISEPQMMSKGCSFHLRNERYLGSMKPFSVSVSQDFQGIFIYTYIFCEPSNMLKLYVFQCYAEKKH